MRNSDWTDVCSSDLCRRQMPSVARFSKKKSLSFPVPSPLRLYCLLWSAGSRAAAAHASRTLPRKIEKRSCADTPPDTQSLSSCVANADGGSGHFERIPWKQPPGGGASGRKELLCSMRFSCLGKPLQGMDIGCAAHADRKGVG